ncbi:hypothetical protein AwDysgo_04290 [Bacteroidales bacterium]|nr:hypothetical protein AwDysgo_04290 [Bacteroidales bacterium]
MMLASCGNNCGAKAEDSSCIAKKDSAEVVLNIPVKIKPEFVAAYKVAFNKCQAGTLQEDACLEYEIFQSYADSTEFHIFERWHNKAGHLFHMTTEHFNVYMEETKGMSEQAKTKMLETYVCPLMND